MSQMLDNDALEQRRRYAAIPDAVGIDDDNRTSGANAEARRLTALHATGTEQQSFTLEKSGQPGV